jgi:hypothetical protein
MAIFYAGPKQIPGSSPIDSRKNLRENKELEQYHHEWRQPGDKIAR